MSNLACYLILSLIKDKAKFIIKFGSPVLLLASSRANFTKLENGLSYIAHAILGLSEQYMRAVTAPIDRPHKQILEYFSEFFK